MTRNRRLTVLGVLTGLYLVGLGVLGGIVSERLRFDAVRTRIVSQLEEAIRRAHAHAMAREHDLRPAASPSASPATDTERRPSVWRGYLEMVDAAVARRDVTTAVRAWREAHAAALRTRAWRPLVETGDALMRIAHVDGRHAGYIAQARKDYLAALTRARADRSADGVLRVAEAFSALGDHRVVEDCLVVAERLGASPDHEVIVRLRALPRAVDARGTPRFEP
jgi:hypothetical protein